MEARLAEYRAKRQNVQNSTCSRVYSWVFGSENKQESPKPSKESENISNVQPAECRKRTVPVSDVKTLEYHEDIEKQTVKSWRDYCQLGLKIVLWLCLWKFFIEVGFGAVYFVVSCSYLMYVNTRTEPRQRGRLSAYSVFNPNQERLDGTFTAEQFEKELRMGAGSVR